MNNEKKGEFSLKVEEIAKGLIELVKNDSKKSILIISTDSGETGTEIGVAMCGNPLELAKGVAEIASNEESKEFVNIGLKMALLKSISSKLCNCDECKETECEHAKKENNNE